MFYISFYISLIDIIKSMAGSISNIAVLIRTILIFFRLKKAWKISLQLVPQEMVPHQ